MIAAFARTTAAIVITVVTTSAWAIPNLQLGIQGANYDGGTQTSVAQSSSFSLYAFLDQGSSSTSVTDTYYLSASLIRTDGNKVSEIPGGMSLGSFSFAGLTYQVTGDMVFGTPPLESSLAFQGGSDLAPHGVFPTYFKQFAFNFNPNKKYLDLDVQTNASLSGLTTTNATTGNTYMYGKSFQVDVAGLQQGYAIHFDLYNAACATNSTGCSDLDINSFAPFSHDAQSGGGLCVPGSPGCNSPPGGGGNVPEPASAVLALLALGVLMRKSKRS